MYHSYSPKTNNISIQNAVLLGQRFENSQKLFLILIFALLVSNAARCFASRLARSLAFTATAVVNSFNDIFGFDCLNSVHRKYLRYKISLQLSLLFTVLFYHKERKMSIVFLFFLFAQKSLRNTRTFRCKGFHFSLFERKVAKEANKGNALDPGRSEFSRNLFLQHQNSSAFWFKCIYPPRLRATDFSVHEMAAPISERGLNRNCIRMQELKLKFSFWFLRCGAKATPAKNSDQTFRSAWFRDGLRT